jgi:photosystem II stability/assembly factor-like uncharacterized protein
MNANTFIATTGNGLARAGRDANDEWSVEFLLADQDVRCLAADPLNPAVLYAGTQGNGVLRSNDKGKSWQPAGMPRQIVKSVAVSSHQPGTVYAGTKPAYLFVSRDSGQTWTELAGFRRIPFRWWWFSPAEKPGTAYVQAITLSPTDPNLILAGIEFGAVVRSTDGGQTWSGHRRGALRDCHTLKFHATNGDWAYEAGGSGGGASRSRNGGQTWHKVKAGLAKHYGVACAADPERPEVWYVSVAPGPGKAYGELAEAYLYRAAGGEDWQSIGWGPHPIPHMPIALITDQTAPGHLYAGLTNGDVWFSANYGDTWQKLPFNLKGIWRSLIIL